MVSLFDLFEDASAVRAVVDGPTVHDALTGPAVRRFVQAIHQAATASGSGPVDWLRARQDRFFLFDPERPFGQHPGLGDRRDVAGKPASILSIFAAGDGPVLLRHDHLHIGEELTPDLVARLILVRHAFGPSGIQPMPVSALGNGTRSATSAVAGNRPFLWVDTGTLAGSLTASTVPGPTGEFRFSWPDGWAPGDTPGVTGQVDALTWPSRVVYAYPPDTPGGNVSTAAYGHGAVFGDDTDPAVVPHTVYSPDSKDPTVMTPVRASTRAIPVERFARAWVNPNRVGLIQHVHDTTTVQDREGWTFRWAGLAMFQSRLDRVLDVTIPAPVIPDETLTIVLDQVDEARHEVASRVSRATRKSRGMSVDETRRKALNLTGTDPVTESLLEQVLTGELQVVDVPEMLASMVEQATSRVRHRFTEDRSISAALALEGTS